VDWRIVRHVPMNEPWVSIIMRSFNEAWALRETLPALRIQDYTHWELIVIDSGSTDGSVELIQQALPQHFIQIPVGQYNPSRVMNQGMSLARFDLGIFINADATPQGPNWLRPLVTALQDSKTAAVFGRQIPRPDCEAVYAHDYERCFGGDRESKEWDHFFSMASSGIRKDVWAQRGFSERLQYSEDDEYTRWCRANGYQVRYVPESVAMHSHNYTLAQAWKRSYGEGKALAAVWNGTTKVWNWPRMVLLGWGNDARRDLTYCCRNGRLHEWPRALRVRWVQRRGRLAGFRDGWNAYRTDKVSGCAQPPLWISSAA
jgi:rhamnosyltransferase